MDPTKQPSDPLRQPLPILPQRRVHVINVVSRKGGAGKTTMALLATRWLAEHPSAPVVTLFDLDFSGTSLRDLLGEVDRAKRETSFEDFLRNGATAGGWESVANVAVQTVTLPREKGGPRAFHYAASTDDSTPEDEGDGAEKPPQERFSEALTLAGKPARDIVRSRLQRLVRWVIEQHPEHADFFFLLDNSPGIRGLSKELVEREFETSGGGAVSPLPAIAWHHVFVTTPDRQDLLASFDAWLAEWERLQPVLAHRGRSRAEAAEEAAGALLFLVNKLLPRDGDTREMLADLLVRAFPDRGVVADEIKRMRVASCAYAAGLAVLYRGLDAIAIPSIDDHVPGFGAFLAALVKEAEPPSPARAPAKRAAAKRTRPLDGYYTCAGEEIDLVPVDHGVAVSFTGARNADNASPRWEIERRGLQRTITLDQPGVEVFQMPPGTERARDLVDELRSWPGLRYANPLYRVGSDRAGDVLVLTDRLTLRFDPPRGTTDATLATRFGLHLLEPIRGMPHGYLAAVKRGSAETALQIANRLLREKAAVFAEPDWVQALVDHARRPPDWLESDQWHHENTGQRGGTQGADAGVFRAWGLGATGKDMTIAVIDDAVDIDHPQLDRPRKLVQGLDLQHRTTDPRPRNGEQHGTKVAGVALAARTTGRHRAPAGTAPDARLMPIRISGIVSAHEFSRAFDHALEHEADVVNCSWGPVDTLPVPSVVSFAIDQLVTLGRGGRGTPVFLAAGNKRDFVSTNRWASYKHVIAVAASNHGDMRSSYSNFGPEIWVCAPSNPAGIVTLRVGGGHVDNFGGTSAACPLVSGIAALMLSVNPALRWTEIKDILARTADKIDANGSAFTDSSGQARSTAYDAAGHSIAYGHGRVNAEKAVAAAIACKNGKSP
jgi:hypothetical protein